MKLKMLLLAAGAAVAVSAPANAVNVTSIKIFNTAPDWLQIAEVVAKTAGNVDVALSSNGAVATSSGVYGGGTAVEANAIDGSFNGNYPAIYHSSTSDSSAFLLVTLAHTFDVTSLTLYGRTDCCNSRDTFGYTLFNGTNNVGSGRLNATAGPATDTFAAAGAVPEPATWGLMLVGFGGIGYAMRRNRKVAITFS